MAEIIKNCADFVADRAWGARDLVQIDTVTARLHWTDQAYHWHVNDGEELLVVIDGAILMHMRTNGVEHVERLEAGDMFVAQAGDEHFAEPIGEARLLVVERAGSE